jgi:hypothetical protein
MRFLSAVLFLVSFSCIQAAHAEIYQGIGPLDTMADLKAKYPHATFEQLHPAWAQEQDVMYKITGQGLSGLIIIKFVDHRPDYRHRSLVTQDEPTIKFLTYLMNMSDDESLDVEWVRWIPEAPVPLQRLVAKYGPPQEKGFRQEDLQPYRRWAKKGLAAFLSDDEKAVLRIDYEFTPDEYCATWHAKYPQAGPYTDAAGNDLCVSAKHPAKKKAHRPPAAHP